MQFCKGLCYNRVMSKKTAEEKQEERKRKRQARLQKHIVTCPHCGEDALDHMTKCPHCGGELTPSGYKPMDEEKRKKIQRISLIVGAAAAVVIAVLIFVLK